MKTVEYNNKKLRTLSALSAAAYIIFHGHPFNLLKAFSSGGFYLALIVSFSIAMLLVYTIHKITHWLDQKYGWRTKPFERSVMQFLFGIAVPAVADMILISIYFEFLGQNIVDNNFLLVDFPVIVSFIVVLNLYYVIHYLILTEPRSTTDSTMQEVKFSSGQIDQPGDKVLIIDYNGKHLQFDVTEDIVYFFRDGKLVKALTVHGNLYSFNISLATLEKRFKKNYFCKVNRSAVINCRAVRGYSATEKRDHYNIILKPNYAGNIDLSKFGDFYITKEFLPEFRRIFDNLTH